MRPRFRLPQPDSSPGQSLRHYLVNTYLPARNLSDKSCQMYFWASTSIDEWHGSTVALNQLSPSLLANWLDALRKTTGAAPTIEFFRRSITAVWQHAADFGLILPPGGPTANSTWTLIAYFCFAYSAEQTLSKSRRSKYERWIRAFDAWHGRPMALEELSDEPVLKWLESIGDDTRNREHRAAICATWSHAAEKGLCRGPGLPLRLYVTEKEQPHATREGGAGALLGSAVMAQLLQVQATLDAALGIRKTPKRTLSECVTRFHGERLQRVGQGDLSAQRFDNVRNSIERFVQHVGCEFDLSELAADHLTGYHRLVLRDVAAGTSPNSGRERIADLKMFLRWCYRRELIDRLPRNLDELAVNVPACRVDTFPLPLLRSIFSRCTPRMQLWLLLMANCGMTQQDLSDLAPHQWHDHRIIRKRSKTANWDRTPTVNYPLWDATASLLSEYGCRSGERVLTTRAGTPLKREWINAAGRFVKTDTIGRCWGRLMEDLQMKRRPLKLIRKTAASLLEGHKEFGRYAQYFLGHSPRTVAERHYVVPSQDRFDEAVTWLGEQFALTSARSDSDGRCVKGGAA